MSLIQSGVPIRISAAGLITANHNVRWYPKSLAVKTENQIYADSQGLSCESSVCFDALLLLAVGQQPASAPFDNASDVRVNGNERNCLVVIFAQMKLEHWVVQDNEQNVVVL